MVFSVSGHFRRRGLGDIRPGAVQQVRRLKITACLILIEAPLLVLAWSLAD